MADISPQNTAQFGVNGVQEKRDWPCLTLDEVCAVLAHFANMPPARDVVWHSMRPFSAACVVQLAGEVSADANVGGQTVRATSCVLKRHARALRSASMLEQEHAFIRHLASKGLPVCPALPLRNGHTALELGNWTYEVFLPAKGEDIYRDVMSWKPYFSTAQAHAAGAALAQLHKAAADYTAPERSAYVAGKTAPVVPLVSSMCVVGQADFTTALQQWVARQPGLVAALTNRPWQQDVARDVLPFHDHLRPLLPSIKPAWGHGDWHPSNLFWHANTPVTVLDFGMADRTCAAFDVAVAIERAMVDWLALPSCSATAQKAPDLVVWDQLAAFVAGYQHIRPLSAAERALVVAFLPLVHVEFALSETAYFGTLLQDQASAEVAYTEYLLGHARWFAQAQEGQELLARLPALLAEQA
ncbi:phosphotransferase enzyme family protein [Acetobacter pasteurianus]|uniref:phosphotransferase enzyme family protein n=1 Tax=Acetobacter pasteurianus TaxID=438 RepID=UPI001362415E|nr:phosphotransferase [Acetobacter pasteurianus]QHM91021.1 phosphotransferase [Acetobacter pasteurianus]